MCDPGTSFQPDFYNNVAAVAVVLMFTKVVTHRTRRPRRRCFDCLHGLAVAGAVLAVLAALLATNGCTHGFETLAWIGVGAASFGLVVDVVLDDVFRAERWLAKDDNGDASSIRTDEKPTGPATDKSE